MRLTIKLSCHGCGLAGIQAAFLVRRFEGGKSHHQTRAKLQAAEKMLEEKDAELERLKARVRPRLLACTPPSYFGSPRIFLHARSAQLLALGGSIELGQVPDAPPKAP
jgi:hypothetical protein